jgi:endonuclease-3
MGRRSSRRASGTAASNARTPENPPGYRDLPFKLPEVTPAEKARARKVYKALEARHPDAHCELEFRSPHELLIATILSAQSTDVAVNKVTPGLFAAFPTPADYAEATPKDIEPHIRTIGLFRNKAKHINGAMVAIVERHDGVVPRSMDELLALPGVARKTAGVVLSEAFGINMGVVVDTHVQRVAARLGLVDEDMSVAMIERRLMALFPREKWRLLSHLLIFHGRRVSKARGYSLDDAFNDPVSSKYSSAAKAQREAWRREHAEEQRREARRTAAASAKGSSKTRRTKKASTHASKRGAGSQRKAGVSS